MITYLASALLALSASATDPPKHIDRDFNLYNYEDHGRDWGTVVELLDDGNFGTEILWPTCGNGQLQSPIDIKTDQSNGSVTEVDHAELIGYNYYDFPLQAWNYNADDKSYKIDFLEEEKRKKVEFKIVYDDRIENGYQFFIPDYMRFHSPSEHTVDGQHYDLEVQFYHEISTNTLHNSGVFSQRPWNEDPSKPVVGAMIAVFFNVAKTVNGGGNEASAFVDSVFEAVDHHQEYDRAFPKKVMVNEFLEELNFRDYWNYYGSMTTPPCTEGIQWVILKEVMPVSDNQIFRFHYDLQDDYTFAKGNGNNRAIQPLNGREVLFVEEGAVSQVILGAASAAAVFAALAF